MIRLLHIEWLKLNRSRYFLIMTGLWLLAFLVVPFGIRDILGRIDFSTGDAGVIPGLSPAQFPIFDWTDIWHNLAYLYKLITVLLSVIIVVNIGQEWEEKTMRQNVIDGLSRQQYFLSKLLLLLGFSIASTLLLFIMGLIWGFVYSPGGGWAEITGSTDFIGAYFLHVFLHLNIAFLLINLLRKVGLTIVLLLVFTYFIEPIFASILSLVHHFGGTPDLSGYLPIQASWDLIPIPFGKYILQPVTDHVTWQSVLPALGWLVVAILINARICLRKDLK